MARCGNHGQIIPRNKALLSRMYWHDKMTLVEIGERYGVEFSSVRRVFRQLGIPTRGQLGENKVKSGICRICGAPAYMKRHAGNGSMYGRLCKEHRREHYNRLAREYARQPAVHARQMARMRQWYVNGAAKPITEEQWITKGRHLLRSAKRVLATGSLDPAASPSAKRASAAAPTSPRSCRRSSATSSAGV